METGATNTSSAARQGTDRGLEECIRNCDECYQVCLKLIPHCLSKGGRHAEQQHITTLLNCAKICQTSADFMLTNSELHIHTCGACGEVCAKCAEHCERIADDDQMRRCVDVCKRCAESCRQMSSH